MRIKRPDTDETGQLEDPPLQSIPDEVLQRYDELEAPQEQAIEDEHQYSAIHETLGSMRVVPDFSRSLLVVVPKIVPP